MRQGVPMNTWVLGTPLRHTSTATNVWWWGGMLSVLVHALVLASWSNSPMRLPRAEMQRSTLQVRWLPTAPAPVQVASPVSAPPPSLETSVPTAAKSPSTRVAAVPDVPPAAAPTTEAAASSPSLAEPARPPVGIALAPVALGGWGGAGWGRRAMAASAVEQPDALAARLHSQAQAQAQARLQAQAQLAQQAQAEALARAAATHRLLAEVAPAGCEAAPGEQRAASCDAPLPR